MRTEQHQDGEATFRTTLDSLISAASPAAESIERWKTGQKRELLVSVFSNLALRGGKLEYSIHSPFHLMVNRSSYASWLGEEDSNLH